MSEKDKGGAAFPELESSHLDRRDDSMRYESTGGMTLRDYFAAKALAALIGREDKEPENRGAKAVPILALMAYQYADAMIAERAK